MNILYLFLGISFKKHDFTFHSYGVSFVLKSCLRNAWKCLAWWFSRKEMGLQSSPREEIQRCFLVFDVLFFPPDFEFHFLDNEGSNKTGKPRWKECMMKPYTWLTHSPHLLWGGSFSPASVPFLEMQSGASKGRIRSLPSQQQQHIMWQQPLEPDGFSEQSIMDCNWIDILS